MHFTGKVHNIKMSQRKLLTKNQVLNNSHDVESLVDDLKVLMAYLQAYDLIIINIVRYTYMGIIQYNKVRE